MRGVLRWESTRIGPAYQSVVRDAISPAAADRHYRACRRYDDSAGRFNRRSGERVTFRIRMSAKHERETSGLPARLAELIPRAEGNEDPRLTSLSDIRVTRSIARALAICIRRHLFKHETIQASA